MRFLLLLCLLAAPVQAQLLRSSLEVETVAGTGLNLALRGPWMEEAWRKPIPRALIFTGMSVTYERLIDVNGWSWKDVGQRAFGYFASELVIDVVVVKLLHVHLP